MKNLGLLRHAKSDWGDARARDFDRPLNKRGRTAATVIGGHLRDYGVKTGQRWDRIIASPAARAAETIERAAQGIGYPSAKNFAVNWDRRVYLASSATLIDLLRETEDRLDNVLLVGHNPGLEDLIFDLVPDDGTSPLRDMVMEKYPTATFAVLRLNIEHWAELAEGCAAMVHMMRPRDLDPALGPDITLQE